MDRDGRTGLRPDPGHAGAAHPPREGDLQHLHHRVADRPHGQHLPGQHGTAGPPGGGAPEPPQGGVRQGTPGRRCRGAASGSAGRPSTSSSCGRRRSRRRSSRSSASSEIIGGLELGRFYPDLADCLLVCVTEQKTREQIDALARGAGRCTMSGPERTVGTRGLVFNEPLIFEQGSPGRVGYSLPPCDVPGKKAEALIPAAPPARADPRPARGERGGRGAPLHADLAVELRDRPGLLPARLVHDEVQPAGQRGRGAAARLCQSASVPAGRRWPRGRCELHLGAGAVPGGDQRAGPRHAPPLGRGARRADRRHDDPGLPPVQGEPAAEDPHPRVGPRDQPGQLGALRVPGRDDQVGPAGGGGAAGGGRGHGRPGGGHHDHQPQHAGPLRGAHRRDRRDRPRQGRPGLLRRRQPERHHGDHAAGRLGRGS